MFFSVFSTVFGIVFSVRFTSAFTAQKIKKSLSSYSFVMFIMIRMNSDSSIVLINQLASISPEDEPTVTVYVSPDTISGSLMMTTLNGSSGE